MCDLSLSLPGQVVVGPSLANIGAVATGRVEGMSAEQSIREPDAHLVEDFPSGTMPQWGEVLSDTQIDALVGFLLTRKA